MGKEVSDEVDKANEAAEIELAARLTKRFQTLKPIGCCYNCEETLPEGKRLFCDTDCREDFEARSRRHAR